MWGGLTRPNAGPFAHTHDAVAFALDALMPPPRTDLQHGLAIGRRLTEFSYGGKIVPDDELMTVYEVKVF